MGQGSIYRCIGAGALALWAGAVQAQDARSGEARTMATIRVEEALDSSALTEPSSASRLGLTVFETPASVEILSGDLIRERGDLSVVEAVTRAAGLTDTSSPGNGGTALSARGFSGHGSVMQLYDGTRFYVGAGTLTFPFDTWSIDRIEVLYGPASVLHGEGALGGVVNVIPKKPTRDAEHQVRVSVGADDTWRLGLGSGGPLAETLSYRTDVSYRRSHGWMDDGDSQSLAASAALRLDVSPALALTLSHDYGDQEPERYFGVPLVDGSLNEDWRYRNFNVQDARLRYRDDLTRLRVEWAPSEHLAVVNESYYLRSDRNWRNAEAYAWRPDERAIELSDFIEIRHLQTQRGNRTHAVTSHRLFGLENRVAVGFDLNRIDFEHINNSPYGGALLVDVDQPGLRAFVNLAGTYPRYGTDSRQFSLFAEDRLSLTQRWTLVTGLRHDEIEVERADLVNGGGFEKRFHPTNWRIGTVFAVTPTLAAYGQYATHAGHLGSLITTSASQAQYDLSTGEQWEIGIKHGFAGGEWTLAAYDITRRKLLSTDPDEPSVTQQIGAQSSRGIEGTLALRLAQGLRLDANVAVLEARYEDFVERVGDQAVDRSGNTPRGIPERTANLWLRWAFHEGWQASAGWRYVGSRYVNNANDRRVGSYNTADLNVSWRATDNVTATVRLDNAFDRIYSTSASTSQWLLARPRTLSLWVDAYF